MNESYKLRLDSYLVYILDFCTEAYGSRDSDCRLRTKISSPKSPSPTMPTESQVYLSTRGGSRDFSFRAAVLKGLASDGGLFIPHSIPQISDLGSWSSLSFQSLALKILQLYISEDEIPTRDLEELLQRSYATFRAEEVTPLVTLRGTDKLYLLELFHGPTYAFKDVALQFLGNLFEYFLQKENEGKVGADRDHLTVLGATSGDTGRFFPSNAD
jgi:threonine synthase